MTPTWCMASFAAATSSSGAEYATKSEVGSAVDAEGCALDRGLAVGLAADAEGCALDRGLAKDTEARGASPPSRATASGARAGWGALSVDGLLVLPILSGSLSSSSGRSIT